LFVIVALFSIMFLFGGYSGFIIDLPLLKNYFLDYLSILFIFAVLSIIIGLTVQNKKYFRYKTEGLRALRSYRSIIQALSIVLCFVPFYVFF
jgi:hypothetical protein